ncbi:dynein light chain Tctex-type 1-like [Harmonia axyridis]|uniref:dynein light chain Tctex-type 1-like n=1 Tax=Harmonia axyridis TaxID=115357 RepID=UPI001E275C0C|nr:dynein light chain Tctex-type 1-like [Harmonia axyridis]
MEQKPTEEADQKPTEEVDQDELQFPEDEVRKIIIDAVENVIGGNGYQHAKVDKWTTEIVEACTFELTNFMKPYKYILSCSIMQKNGAEIHTANSCFWDNNTDGSCTVRWENKTIICIVSIYGLAM